MAAPDVLAELLSNEQPVKSLVVVPRNTAPPNLAEFSSKMLSWMLPTPFCRAPWLMSIASLMADCTKSKLDGPGRAWACAFLQCNAIQ